MTPFWRRICPERIRLGSIARGFAACWLWGLSLSVLAALAAAGCGGIAIVDPTPDDDDTTTTTTSSSTNTDAPQLDATIDSVLASANCQPVVPADPLRVQFELIADNPSSATANVEIAGALLDSMIGSISFDVISPSFSIPGNSSVAQPVEKLGGSGVGINACDLCNETDLELTVDLLVEGDAQSVTVPVSSISCVF